MEHILAINDTVIEYWKQFLASWEIEKKNERNIRKIAVYDLEIPRRLHPYRAIENTVSDIPRKLEIYYDTYRYMCIRTVCHNEYCARMNTCIDNFIRGPERAGSKVAFMVTYNGCRRLISCKIDL